MTIPPYLTILDAEIDPDSPITTSLMFRLRDNLLASFGAQAGAPLLNRGAINIGGSGTDGNCVDATSLVGSGLYDFEDVTLTLAKTLPILTIIRATGSVNISSTVGADVSSLLDRIALRALGATVVNEMDYAQGTYPPTAGQLNAGNYGEDYPNSYGGDANVGAFGLKGTTLTRIWEWLIKHPLLGSGSVLSGASLAAGTLDATAKTGGGSIIILADGPIVITGTLTVAGVRRDNGAVNRSGAAGSIVLVSGTSIALSGATLTANGGQDIGHGGGLGAGGYIAAIAPIITGSPTINVTADNNGVSSGSKIGLYESINTLTQGQINALLLR